MKQNANVVKENLMDENENDFDDEDLAGVLDDDTPLSKTKQENVSFSQT